MYGAVPSAGPCTLRNTMVAHVGIARALALRIGVLNLDGVALSPWVFGSPSSAAIISWGSAHQMRPVLMSPKDELTAQRR